MLSQPLVDVELTPSAPPARRAQAPQPLRDKVGRPGLAGRETTYRRLLGLADMTSAWLALLLVLTVVGDDRLRLASLLSLPLIVLASKAIGLYDRDELVLRKTTIDEVPALFQLATTYTLVFWLLDRELIIGSLGKAQVVVMWATLVLFLIVGRALGRRLARRVAPTERVLVIGDQTSYDRLEAKLGDHSTGVALVGRLSPRDDTPSAMTGPEFERLGDVVDRLDVHRIVIASAASEGDATLEMIRAAKGLGVRVSLLPRILEVVGSSVEHDDVYGLPVLGVRRFGLSRSSRLLKRTFDVVGSAVGLIVLAPLLLAAAVAIKLDTRGPVFFRQTRVGRDGTPFGMFKLRSMVDGAERSQPGLADRNEADGLFKIAEDPRITRVGRLLRSTSLDELPQLINVLRGEMSLVGPRPLVLDEDCKITGWERRRLSLTPGMTGHWQILGASRVPLAEMVKIDYLYVAGWSLWSDVKLLVRTVPCVFARRGL